MFSSIYKQYILNDHKFFAIQNFGLYRSVDKDSLWSFVSLDDNFQKKRLFKNPVHVGKEEQIIANRANMDRMVNYWMEYLTSVDIYNGQLTIKYPDTDTIYCYDDATNQLLPQYAILQMKKKGIMKLLIYGLKTERLSIIFPFFLITRLRILFI